MGVKLVLKEPEGGEMLAWPQASGKRADGTQLLVLGGRVNDVDQGFRGLKKLPPGAE
jgi:hypothetical protein